MDEDVLSGDKVCESDELVREEDGDSDLGKSDDEAVVWVVGATPSSALLRAVV